MNGRACILCGKGGCVESLEFSGGSIKLIVYICSSCKTEDYEEKVLKHLREVKK